ncbi:MAG TPA: glycosyltransferase [Cyclobacteriaceae bacterium]|nr:glycosyltransferase [Cyclobacteriaceae bacterium]
MGTVTLSPSKSSLEGTSSTSLSADRQAQPDFFDFKIQLKILPIAIGTAGTVFKVFLQYMGSDPKYSVVIPVYNRPKELDELLQSLAEQSFRNFEVLIVEDGSKETSQSVYEKYSSILSIQYFFKPNSGPGPSRNFGFERAKGEYFVVFDSDCLLPSNYFETVEKSLASQPLDAWGGPDRGHEKFTPLQQAMAYTMSSVLTTGGIRGGKNSALNFQPRSFNMGMSRTVFEKTGGFKFDRLAEDIELSIRIRKAGFRVGLIPEAFVYHKRRATLSQFYQQVKGFGAGRARVGKVHPEEIKVTHWFPFLFLVGLMSIPVIYLFNPWLADAVAVAYFVYFLAIVVDATRSTQSVAVAILSSAAALVQLSGYGIGFIREKMKAG